MPSSDNVGKRAPRKSALAILKCFSRPRHDWYQTDSRVVVTILVKKRSQDDVQCDIKETSVSRFTRHYAEAHSALFFEHLKCISVYCFYNV